MKAITVERPPFETGFRLAGDGGIYVASLPCCLRGLMESLELSYFSPLAHSCLLTSNRRHAVPAQTIAPGVPSCPIVREPSIGMKS